MNQQLPTLAKAGACREWFQLSALLDSVFCTLLEWQERARQRYHLARLDDRLLKDVGLGRAEAEAEYRKPFWRT
jgi:uncharacterized protein YjiS (DUF1127 family)